MESLVIKMRKTIGTSHFLKRIMGKSEKILHRESAYEKRLEDFTQRHWNLSLVMLLILIPMLSVMALFIGVNSVILPIALMMGWI